jgi:hypothetical protein
MREKEKNLTSADLNLLLEYKEDTGLLYWKQRTPDSFSASKKYSAVRICSSWNVKHAGKEALNHKTKHGYLTGCVLSVPFMAHRVIWCMHTGFWPENFLDHINGDRSDNRLINLRQATALENARNLKLYRKNTSGVPGVCYKKQVRKWIATIRVCDARVHLGYFSEKPDAIAARKKAERFYGFHENHGRVS